MSMESHDLQQGAPLEVPADVVPTTLATPEQRRASLASGVASAVRGGWSVESQTEIQAVMVKPGTKVNHLLHLILTLVTVGLWVIPWILVTMLHKKTKHLVIAVDDYGRVLHQG